MSVFNVIQLFGGLAMFLYGMSLMSDKLEKLAGGKLEQIFEKLTSNRFKGLLLGVLVTAVVQSSSATTVMLVGFVNSGIMRLSQAISIIMGANIGTTVTTWLLSLSGLEGDTIAIQLCKPENFAFGRCSSSRCIYFLAGRYDARIYSARSIRYRYYRWC